MTANTQELRQQANALWKQAMGQLNEVKGLLLKQRGRLESDFNKLLLERDKLLKRLGEQTYKLANQGSIRVPTIVKETVDHLNEVVHRLTTKRRVKHSKAGGKKRKVTRRRVNARA